MEPKWHTLPAAAVLSELGSGPEGLTPSAAAQRLEEHGPNRLRLTPPISAWRILVSQFRSVVVLLLGAAAGIAWLLGDPVEALAIVAVLLINTILGFATELRARRAVEALRELEVPHATVIRGGNAIEIAAEDLVPGDLLTLEAGQSVPADARLVEAHELRTIESPLTGESLPVEKRAGDELPAETSLADRSNLLFMATAVVAGSARAVVVATGSATAVGRIGELTSSVENRETPLERRLDQLGHRLIGLALAVTAVVVVIGLMRGEPLGRMLETGVALAIAAVPEGLPVVATIALAVGVWRMARRNALVRRLPAVEALGSTTVVCTDKTGTLTAGEMTVTRVVAGGKTYDVSGAGYAAEGDFTSHGARVDPTAEPALREALRIGALVNRAEIQATAGGDMKVVGDPTEAALIVAARKAGLERARLVEESPEERAIPFSSERQWMATVHGGGSRLTLVKGAPERVIAAAVEELDASGAPQPIDERRREALLEQNRALAADGLRVIAVARASTGPSENGLPALTFVGLMGMEDPAAEGVRETIDTFRAAGVRTVMITGDQRLTAAAVARDLGILEEGGEVLEGSAVTRMPDAELARRLEGASVLSRVEPKDKLRIVEALQSRAEIVAMLGDGINDAAALKRADIGVAMGGRGTDVAKEAAAVVLQDDRFPTIGAAIEEGRVIFDNIRHFVFYLFSCNVAEVLVILIATLAGLPQPLLPLQILWLNLVTDTFPALSLAVEPGQPGVMRRRPRDPEASILSRSFIVTLLFYASLITAVTLGAYLWALGRDGGTPEHARTIAFLTLALAQLFHLGNARNQQAVVTREAAFRNRWAIGAVALVILLQVAAIHIGPLAGVLGLTPLPLGDWLVAAGLAAIPAVVGQVIKMIRHHG